MEKFLEELEELSNQPLYLMQVAEKIKSHNLPVIIYGAGEMAKAVTKVLNSFEVSIFGYAVDEEYYQSNQIYLGLPVFNFKTVSHESDKYVFVLGIGYKNAGIANAKISNFMNNKTFLHYQILLDCKEIFDYEYISKNQNKFLETYCMLSDDISKATMIAYLKTHVTNNPADIMNLVAHDEYFNELTRSTIGGSYVDCGAYTGDTVEKFINFVDGNYKKIFAIEADPKNFSKMENLVREKNYKNIHLVNCGVWNTKGTLYFNNDGSTFSSISERGSFALNTDTIDNIVGDENITFIKMDIEGAELPALQGAIKTLETSKPALAISVYHRKDDLITIPQFIKSFYKDCRFYLRKYDNVHPLWEIDLYVIPN